MYLVALLLALVFAVVVLVSALLVWALFTGLTIAFHKDTNWTRRLWTSARTALPFPLLSLAAIPLLLAGPILESSAGSGTNQLPNGYRLMIVSPGDPGWIYDPENENTDQGVDWKKEALSGVVRIQVNGSYILGACTERGLSGGPNPTYPISSYFLLDTASHSLSRFDQFEELKAAAGQRGIRLRLQIFYEGYSSFGLPKFMRLAHEGSEACLAIFVLLCVVWIFTLRRLRTQEAPLSA